MENQTVDFAKNFFDLSRPMQKIDIKGGAVMGQVVAGEGSTPLKPLNPRQRESGRDYATEYIEKENRSLLENDWETDGLPDSQESGNSNDMEQLTSVGSAANLADVEDDDYNQVYRNYKFDPPTDSKLIIEQYKERIIRMIDTNQVVVIVGATGCGKTTQVPQYILDHHARLNKRCNIIVTQPRRLAATSVARRVCEEREWELSTIVGYQIGLDNRTSPDTRLTFCTTGVLREKLVQERNMMKYTHVILDEVHERDIDMDFLLLIVRKLLRTNSRTVKVILMSATINSTKFAEYFSLPVNNKLERAPVIPIDEKSSYKVFEHYLDQLEKIGPLPEIDYGNPTISPLAYDVAVRLIKYLDNIDAQEFHQKHNVFPSENVEYKHAVLVFLPGIHEIEELYNRLEAKKENKFQWHIIPLHSSITREEQGSVFKKPAPGYRKIILSTNIAESSLTVPDVGYVIDFCLTKHLICDPQTNFSCLQLAWASHFSCVQRKGRAGRVKIGRVYRMVSQDFYDNFLPEECPAEMLRCPLEQTVLKAKMLKMGEPKALLALALDPPDLGQLERTILVLKEAGAMLSTCEGKPSRFDGDITFLGVVMAQLPLDIHLSKLIMLGHLYSILDDCIIISAFMSVRNVFNDSFHDRLSAYAAKISFSEGTNSDCITYLHVYTSYKEKLRTNYFRTSNVTKETYFRRQFLNERALREADILVDELRKRLANLGISTATAHGRVHWDARMLPIIRKIVIAGAFYPNFFIRGAQGGQIDEKDAVKSLSGKDPKTSVYLQGLPPNQPGELYKRAIKEALKECGIVKDVTFDGSSKVFVEFERGKSDTLRGKISLSVHRAVKMRQLRIPIVIQCLPIDEAHKRAEKLGIKASRLLAMAEENDEDYNINKKNYLPSLETQTIDFTPCYVEDPNRFWVHSSGCGPELNWIQNSLNTKGNTRSPSEPIQVGQIYAVPYPIPGGKNFRARVCSVLQNVTAMVLYIDYGNVERDVPLKYIYEISPIVLGSVGLASIPPLALECTLGNVAPLPSLDERDNWSEAAIRRFQDFMNVESVSLWGEVYSVVDGVVSLSVKRSGELVSINEILVNERLAVRVKENCRSQADYELREQARNYNCHEKPKSFKHLQPQLPFHSYNSDPEPVSKNERTTSVPLRGPVSPLEMKVYGCSRVTCGKEVSVDLQSVNAALLDNDPDDPHERLLIAGSVSQNPTGTRIRLIHTTLMPNIHGLAALMSMIFAPMIELRRNTSHTFFCGALCGLGFDKNNYEPLFPEHDMEIVFDCKITLEDMLTINKLRYWMNIPMETEKGSEVAKASMYQILLSQRKIQEFLVELLNRSWESQEVALFHHSYQWHQYKEEELLHPGLSDPLGVFQPHWGLIINDDS